MADASSTLSLLVLCATLNAPLEIEAVGDDEKDAVHAIACCFGPLQPSESAAAPAAPAPGPHRFPGAIKSGGLREEK